MVGVNRIVLNNQAMREAVEAYVNKTLIHGERIVVSNVYQERSDPHEFVCWFRTHYTVAQKGKK